MEWINIHSSTVNSPEFIGAEPIDRATWLCLMVYCVGQENGGRIKACADWGDRKWQQLARVTHREIRRASELWTWEEADLVVSFYPLDKEEEIKRKRIGGKATANKRWAGDAGSSVDSSATSSGEPTPTEKRYTEGKGREGKGKGKGSYPTPPAIADPPAAAPSGTVPDEAEVLAWAAAWPGNPAMGIPPGIPVAWALGWFAYRTRPGQAPLGDWRLEADRAFRSDWANRHPKAIGPGAPRSAGEASPTATRIGLEKALREATALVTQREDELTRAKDVPGEAGQQLREKFMARLREAEEAVGSIQARLKEVAA